MERPLYVIPIGDTDASALDIIAEAIRDEFGIPVTIGERAIGAGHAYDSRRDQYSSRTLLRTLLEVFPAPDRVLGVTDVDLFMPILTFVFGEAQLGGRAAVVSLHRLHQSFYGLQESVDELYERAIKEALHEVGHMHGLIHCQDYTCVMRASRVVEEIDLKDGTFCAACRAKLRAGGSAA